MVWWQMHLCWDHSAPRQKLPKRKIFQCNIFLSSVPYRKYSIFLMNFYFYDSTAVKSLINLSHCLSTNSLLVLKRTCKYFIHVSCVTESTDSDSWFIPNKVFIIKVKKSFYGSKKGFLCLVSQRMMQNCEFHINSLQLQILANISIN